MKAIALFSAFLFSGYANSASPKTSKDHQMSNYKVINLKNEFVKFWSLAKGKNFEEQLKLWNGLIEKPHQDLYDSLVWSKTSRPDWEKNKREKLASYFDFYKGNYETILASFKAFDSTLSKQIQKYKQTFPDAVFDLPIYAIPSGGALNGKAGDLSKNPGHTVLVFGLDMIVERKDDTYVLYSHELFHIYHVGLLDLTEAKASSANLTLPLWLEGFATYVSGVFNPTASDAALLLDKDLEKAKKEVPWLANAFLKVADQKAWDDKNPTTYMEWFGFNKRMPRPDLPMRTGYLLGLEVCRELAKKYPLTDMVHWSIGEASTHSLEALEVLRKDVR